MSENCNCGYPYGHARYCPLRSSVEYTPTVNAVREAYAEDRYPKVLIVPAYEEFDRMIAEVERKAAEKAWDKGYDRGFYDREALPGDSRDASEGAGANPYRQ